jgi:outer membrane receptor protein involved in Fe transport
VRVDRADGYTRNAHLDRRDTNDFDERSARAGLSWQPLETLSLRLSTLWAEFDNGYDAFAIDNSRNTRADKPGRDAQRSHGASLALNWVADDRLELQSLTAWTDSDIDYGYDGDWGFDPDYDFTQRFLRAHRTLSQDLRLVSAGPGRGEPGLGWIFGAYALELSEDSEQTDRFAGELLREPLASDYRAVHFALYGQGEWQIDGDWRATLGLRGERRSATYRDSDGADYGPTDRMLGGQLSIERRLGARIAGYATLARGYKAGGFNIGALVPESRRLYDPETLDSAELGVRIGRADGAIAAQLAVFSMRRRDQQVSTSLQLDPGDPLSFIFLTDNAADGRNEGIETTVSWQAAPRVRLESAFGLLRTRYVGYRVAGRSLDGREQAHAPEYQIDLAAHYTDPRGWFARAELHAVDDFFFSDTHDQRSGAYSTLDFRVGFERERWGAVLWVRNALDAGYTQRGFFFGNEPPDFPDKLYVQPGEPRRIGASAWRALL